MKNTFHYFERAFTEGNKTNYFGRLESNFNKKVTNNTDE